MMITVHEELQPPWILPTATDALVPRQPSENNLIGTPTTINALEDPEPPSQWVLPAGAATVILEIAATRLLQLLLEGRVFKGAVPVDFAAVRHLIQHYPVVCQRSYEFPWEGEGDTRQLYPLAMLCLLRPPLDVIQAVTRAHPAALTIAEPAKGCIPLHYACSAEGCSVEIVEYLLGQCPETIRMPRTDGMLPLALASYFKAPLSIVTHVAEKYPGAISILDKEDWTCLHAAARGNASLSVVEMLYRMDPSSIHKVDDMGRTPLHLACMKRGMEEVVEFLHDQAPASFVVEDNHHLLPIFHAAKSQTVEALEWLLERQHERTPDAELPPADPFGATLLHFAVVANDPQVIEYLCTRYPTMASLRSLDQMQYTVLHVGCLCNAPLVNIQALLKYHPELLPILTTAPGNDDCVRVARRNNASKQLIEYLEQQLAAIAPGETTTTLAING